MRLPLLLSALLACSSCSVVEQPSGLIPRWTTAWKEVATDDDRRRIAYIDRALDGVRQCLDEGIPVHSYLYWSLLDNFEWTSGYGVHFGLVAVDRSTFRRTLKPSALHFGALARANRI